MPKNKPGRADWLADLLLGYSPAEDEEAAAGREAEDDLPLEISQMLRDSFAQVEAWQLAELEEFAPEAEPLLSPKYQRKFDRMLQNPWAYARRQAWTKGLRYGGVAAALLLVIGGSLLLQPPATMQAAVGLPSVSFAELPADVTLPEVQVGYLPEGFSLVFERNLLNQYLVRQYADGAGGLCWLCVYVAGAEEEASAEGLSWRSADGLFGLSLGGNLPWEELQRIAAGVRLN